MPLKVATKKRPKIGFQDQLLLHAGQKYCRMLQREHSAILSTFIKLPFTKNTFVLSIFKWPLNTGFTVHTLYECVFRVEGCGIESGPHHTVLAALLLMLAEKGGK